MYLNEDDFSKKRDNKGLSFMPRKPSCNILLYWISSSSLSEW